MPPAGAIVPPAIIPLRKPVPGIPTTHIDTTTYIELETETSDCKIYFSTDGSKPNAFQLKVGGRETTFKYRGPFTLKGGKRTLKVVAVSRDGLQESNVVTKTFTVNDLGPPGDDDIMDMESLDLDNFKPNRSITPKPWKSSKNKKNLQNSMTNGIENTGPKEAWASTTYDYVSKNTNGEYIEPGSVSNSVNLPDGPFNPTNYSGTQVNFWGVAPANLPGSNLLPGGASVPYGTWPSELGMMTNQTLRNMGQKNMTVEELRQLIQLEAQKAQRPPEPPTPAITYPTEPELTPKSPGHGDWKGQIQHIYAHLLQQCKRDPSFKSDISSPIMGKIAHAEFTEEDGAFLLTLSLARPGYKAPPKPPQPVSPPPKPKPRPKLATAAKTAAAAKVIKPKPKLEAPKAPKAKDTMKDDPYFVTEEYEAEGTLKPWPAFDSERDAELLRKAMKGIGTDEKSIINTMGYRNAAQREEICITFKTTFGKDLREELKGETSGDFKECLKALCLAPPDYDASEIRRAVKGLGTDEDALTEILCTRTNVQIKAMKAAYKKLYEHELEKDVKDDTSGDYRRVLVSQIQANRDESQEYDLTAAKLDAKALYKAGEGKWGTDESTFNQILCQRSFPYLRAVFDEYGKISKKDIEEAIKSEFSGDIKDSLVTVVRVIRNKPLYFARKMQKAMKGLGTDDQALIRVVVSRCECDMVQIKAAFIAEFKGSLGEWIRDDTSGDYMEMLLALVGEREAPVPTAEELEEAQAPPELEEVEEEHIEQTPTLTPADPFNPKADCEALKKAMKGLGTDEKAIINIMCHRSCEQRLEIVKMYKTMFGKDLPKEFKSELSSNFLDLIIGLCQSASEFDATHLKKAMKGLGTDEDCLIEILCTRSNTELDTIVEVYHTLFKKKLEEDIISDTSGHLKRLLVSLLQANRPEGNVIDRRKARKDAKDLLDAGDKKFGTDESRFNVILCSRSYPQLRATFEEYGQLAGKDIEESIKSEMSGDLRKGMLTIVRCVRSQQQYFAKALYDSMDGLGTKDNSLIRTVVSRCELDMVQIKQIFEQQYKQPLGQFIKGDTSGDYRNSLLKLVGEEQYIKK